jgi:hypothetical protein
MYLKRLWLVLLDDLNGKISFEKLRKGGNTSGSKERKGAAEEDQGREKDGKS